MSLFEQGDFELHSGGKSKYRINCDRLSDEDIAMVAERLAEVLPGFGSVEGIPSGGLRLAAAMSKHMTFGAHLIVDDVWTTGGSMRTLRNQRLSEYETVYGAVIFQRGFDQMPYWAFSFADVDI